MAVITMYRASVTVGLSLRGTVFSFDPIQDANYVTQANLTSSMTNPALVICDSTPVKVDVPGNLAVETLPNGIKGLRDPENPDFVLDAARIIDRMRQGDQGYSLVPE